MGGAGYFDYFAKWMTDVLMAIGDWLGHAGWKLTHDPLWIGIALTVIGGLVTLYVLKRKAAG